MIVQIKLLKTSKTAPPIPNNPPNTVTKFGDASNLQNNFAIGNDSLSVKYRSNLSEISRHFSNSFAGLSFFIT